MASMFIRYRVRDFNAWKSVFDEREGLRRQSGMTSHSIHRDPDDPALLTVALRVNDIGRAKEYAASAGLREAITRAGVEGAPEIWFGEDVEEKRY